MNDNCFIDTNILVYCYTNDEPVRQQKALDISEVSSDFNVFVNKPDTIERACQIADKYQYSFYDSLIISAALSCNCKTLYSEDMQGGQVIDNSLTIVNPFK